MLSAVIQKDGLCFVPGRLSTFFFFCCGALYVNWALREDQILNENKVMV